MLSATSTGLLLNSVSGIWKVPAAQQVIYGTTAATAAPEVTALASFSVTSSLLDLSPTDENGQSSFDVVGACYGMDSTFAALLNAYAATAQAVD